MALAVERSILLGRTGWPLIILALWLAAALVLISHFRFYYEVTWPDALKWGLGDGLIWALLLGFSVSVFQRFQRFFQSLRGFICFMCAAVLGGVLLHPTISTLFFWAIDGSISHPFLEDVLHLVMKRLPQGILAGIAMGITGVLLQLLRPGAHRAPAQAKVPTALTSAAPWVVLKDPRGVRRIPLDDIFYLEAAGNYVALCTQDREHLNRTTLKTMEESLKNCRFRRISRKHIVNLDCIRSIRSTKPKGGVVTLDNNISLPVSRRYNAALQSALASAP